MIESYTESLTVQRVTLYISKPLCLLGTVLEVY